MCYINDLPTDYITGFRKLRWQSTLSCSMLENWTKDALTLICRDLKNLNQRVVINNSASTTKAVVTVVPR